MKNQKKYYLTKDVFQNLFKEIISRKCSEIPKNELIERVANLDALNFLKKRREGLEKCFHGFFNGCEIIVCTTYSGYLRSYKEHDLGWVLLISPNSKEPFFSFPIRRTKNFCSTTLAWLDCMIDIAQNWPTLPGTDTALKLVRENIMHMRKFVPPNSRNTYPRRKPYYFWIVEMDLKPGNSKFLIEKFKNFYRYRSKEDQKSIEGDKPLRQYARVLRSERKKSLAIKQQEQKISNDEIYNDIKPQDFDYNDGDHLE